MMKPRLNSRSCSLLLLAAALPGFRSTAADPPADARAAILREIYVPYDEFRSRAEGDPRGVIMGLDEYRELVLRALARSRTGPPPPLPPMDASIISAEYSGVLAGRALRLRARLKALVASDGWVRCDLGAPLPQLGTVTVDDAPGWILIESGPLLPGPRAHLLLRGRGEHEVVILFSLPASEKDDRWSVEGPIVTAAASRLEIEVPGAVEAWSEPPYLETRAAGASSRLILAAGDASRFKLEWKRKRTLGDSPAYLAAEHHLTFTLGRDNPVFAWDAIVTIAQRKADSLLFREPPGAHVSRVEGPLVHAWERAETGLRVVLGEPVLGEVRVRMTGVVDRPPDGPAGLRFTLAPPALDGAYSQSGFIALEASRGERLAVETATGAVEAALDEGPPHRARGAPSVPAGRDGFTRLFAFAAPDARLAALVSPVPSRIEARGTHLLRIGEASARLDGRLRVTALDGRAYRILLALPEPWSLVKLEEDLAAGFQPHGVRVEETAGAAGKDIRIELERALAPGEPLDIDLQLENGAFGEERTWERRSLDWALPAVQGAEASRTELGIAIPSSMDALMADLPGWRSLGAEEATRLGLTDRAAVLTTKASAPRIAFTLVHRPVRGEHRIVTHVLALERQVRVRADLRLAAVDRPIEEVSLLLPRDAGPSAIVLGEGIKEVSADLASGRRSIRFSKPWLGTRQLRVEYEAPAQPGPAFPVPVVRLAAEGTDGFSGERFVVLQSRGPVEIEVRAGPGLSPVDVDEVPDFAEAWSGGRTLRAFRFRPGGDPGTLATTVHERAPLLGSLVREMGITTVLGREGTSRTRAEILLGYAREQSVMVRLPAGARPLGVTVNDEPIRAVRPAIAPGPAQLTSGTPELIIPLPPRTYARLEISYERLAGTEGGRGLGLWGSFREEAPVLSGIPVGRTTWTLHHPEGYSFRIRGGNLESPERTGEEEPPAFFAYSFLARLLRGRPPILHAFRSERPRGPLAPVPALTIEEAQGAATREPEAAQVQGRIPAREANAGSRSRGGAPLYRLFPGGRMLESAKLGGDAVLDLSYRDAQASAAARRTLFLVTLLAGWIIAGWRGRKAFLRLVLWGLVLGTTVPLLVDWRSGLICAACEGLAVLLLAAILFAGIHAIFSRLRPTAAFPLVLGLAALLGLTPPGRAADVADGVLIPYDPTRPGLMSAGKERVFVPREKFRELWRLAHPGGPLAEEPPADHVLSSAEYRLRLDGDGAYRLSGSLAVNVLAGRPIKVRLPTGEAHITRVLVDGVDAGVAQEPVAGEARPRPFLELKGPGTRKLELEMAGSVHRELGEHRIACDLLGAPAASLEAELPAGARLAVAQAAVVSAGEKTTIVRVDLGPTGRLDLSWSFPKVERLEGSQIESISYSDLQLTPDGYAVERREKLRVSGRPVDSVEYRSLGSWRITEVLGAEVAEWNAAPGEPAGSPGKLQVFFARPVSEAELRIRGTARMPAAGSPAGDGPLATLALQGASRQETFVGLRHAASRRFRQSVLAGMRRASRDDLLRAFAVPDDAAPDRIYHAFGSGEGETIAAEPVRGEASVATEVALVMNADSLVAAARSRYTVTGPGPLRHEVQLPSGWSVRTVRCEAMRSWEVVEAEGLRRLVVRFQGRAATGTEILWTAERPFDALPDAVEVPPLRAAGDQELLRESQLWLVGAAEGVEISLRDAERLSPISLETAPPWIAPPPGATYRFALRAARADGAGAGPAFRLTAARGSSRLGATVISVARLAEDFLHVNARVVHRIRLAGRDRFRLQLPPGAELVSVYTPNQQSRDVRPAPGGTEIEIVVQSPVTGEQPIDVSYRVRRGDAGPPVILPIAVFDGAARLTDADQYVGVLEAATTLVSAAATTALIPVEAERFPYLPSGIAASSLAPSFRSTSLDWSLTLEERQIEVAPGPAAVVALAELTTVVGGDGTARTRAVYTVRNRSLQFLVVEMPAGASLWGVSLNGKPVAVGEAPAAGAVGQGRGIRIPVEHVGAASLDLEVALQYEEKDLDLPALRGKASFAPPRILDVKVMETVWNVRFPGGYRLRRSGGNMQEVAGSVQYARKVENLLGQLEKITKAASESDSQRVRDQARKEMARLEQALGDNLAELETGNRSLEERERASRIGQADVEGQWSANDRVIQKSQQAQEDLRKTREAEEKKHEEKAAPSKQEQQFLDTTNYLKRSWSTNVAPGGLQKGQAAAPDTDPARGPTIEALLETAPYDGLRRARLPAAPPVAAAAEPAPVDGAKGLKPPPDLAAAGAAPGVEAPPGDAPGGKPYTFVYPGDDAELTLTYTSESTAARLGALVALATAVGLVAWRQWTGGRWWPAAPVSR